MEKRYQIFISSTFTDLVEERQSVLKAILELNHMPAGMELFPASDETAWDLIKDVIDASDYYAIIIGGRYGSMDQEGISYTEKEYKYAYSIGKPIIPLLHKNPDNLPREKTETADDIWEKLQDFRGTIEKTHTCKYWESAEDLKAKIIISLTSEFKKNPGIGWVRADQVPSEDTRSKIYDLKERIQELEKELEKNKTEGPSGTEELQQGDDTLDLYVEFYAKPYGARYSERKGYHANIEPTWDEIFAGISPALINEASESKLRRSLITHLSEISLKEFKEHEAFQDKNLSSFTFRDSEIDTCIIQLRALGLIEESKRKRSVKDTSTYWTLTDYGDRQMVKLRALKKGSNESRSIASNTKENQQ